MAAALKAQGNAYFAKQDWEGAVECYSRSLELEEDPIATSTLLSNRCACYIHLEQFPEAQADASRCINLRPDWSKGHARSGEAYSRSQAFGLAEIACECSSPISIMGLRRLLNYVDDSDNKAVEVAEDKATKLRYIAARKIVQQTAQRNKRIAQAGHMPATAVHSKSPNIEAGLTKNWEGSWRNLLAKADLQDQPGLGIRFLMFANEQGNKGWQMLDKSYRRKSGRGSNMQIEGDAGNSAVQDLSGKATLSLL